VARSHRRLSNGPSAESNDRVPILFSEAVTRQQSGQLPEAITLYHQILTLDPGLPEANCNMGVALAGLGRLDEAEPWVRRAIMLAPDYPQAHANLGMLLKSKGKVDEAIGALRRATELEPGWPEILSKLGIALYETDRLAEAEAAFRQAVKIKPDLAEPHAYLAMTLKELCRLDEAEAAFRRAISFRPESGELYTNLGTVLLSLGRTGEAVSAYRIAIALHPDLADAHNNLGMGLRSLGRLDEAAAALRRAIALRPDFAEAHNNLGNVLLDQEQLDEAMALYRKAIALRPGYAEAYNNMGLALKDMGRLAEARTAVEQAASLAPRKAAYFRSLGELRRFAAGDPQLAALEELARDAASLPVAEQIELHFARAKAFEDLGEHGDSFRQLLAGNALKRRQISYDETATLGGLSRTASIFTPRLVRSRENAGIASSLPVFIIGMMRSGTTLIEQILASHPQVFGAGELKLLGNAVAEVGSPAGCPAEFPDVVRHMSGAEFRALGARYLAVISQLAPDAARITNKMPSNFILAGLIHLALPNAAIIHAVRDPADTCVSCFSKLFTEEVNHTYDLAELGRYYRQYRSLMEHWRRVLPPGRILDVRYEDVVADLEGQARRMVAHCGLAWDPRCLAFHEAARPVRTASATQVRQPIYGSAIGRWRVHKPLLGPLLAELGIGEDSPASTTPERHGRVGTMKLPRRLQRRA
jgi:Flp pilus assembly protein TadD